MTETVTITALGAGGDGIAGSAEERVFVPFTLPGERVDIDRHGNRGRPTRILTASADRVTPPCPHFGTCGGCTLQHMALDAYLAWKREIVARSFALRGIETTIDPAMPTAPGSRRRAVFSVINTAAGTVLGFNRRASHEVVPIAVCPVLAPEIVARLPVLRSMVAIAVKPRRRARLAVTLADSGLDIALDGGGRLDRGQRARLGTFAAETTIARLTVDGDTVFVNRRPEIAAGGAALLPAPGGFVQATASAEAALAAAVATHVGDAAPVADLFAGIGTFTLRLARRAHVTAVENDDALLDALRTAVRHSSGLKPVTAQRRDLFVNPLAPAELDRFGAIVFDPPAAGARAQAEAIAASSVPRVVAVSCNPATLARDARILVDGGYRLLRVLPVDQFLWSAEIEVVAAFAR